MVKFSIKFDFQSNWGNNTPYLFNNEILIKHYVFLKAFVDNTSTTETQQFISRFPFKPTIEQTAVLGNQTLDHFLSFYQTCLLSLRSFECNLTLKTQCMMSVVVKQSHNTLLIV